MLQVSPAHFKPAREVQTNEICFGMAKKFLMTTLTITLADHPAAGTWVAHDMYCIFQRQRPTTGLPPDVLPLSGVLFSQSLMRPATPVFITAASCLNRAKSQLSAVVIVNRSMQEVPVNWALSSLSLSLCSNHTHPHTHTHIPCFINFIISFTISPVYLECAAATSRWGEHIALLPHALDVPYAVGDHGQVHRSRARGSGLLVLSLLRQSMSGSSKGSNRFLQCCYCALSNITKLLWVLRSVEIKHSCDLKRNKEWHTTLTPHWMLVCYQFRKLMQDTAWAFLGNVWGQTGGQSYF